MVVVAPADDRWQRHEDGLGASAGLESEQGATVVDEVEFGIPAATVFLEGPLSFRVGHVLAALDNRRIGAQESVASVLDEVEQFGEIAFQIIKEYPADAACLVAVR